MDISPCVLTSRRERIPSMRIFIPNSSIGSVNNKFRTLLPGNITSNINRTLLRWSSYSSARIALAFDLPATIGVRNYMLIFSHSFSTSFQTSYTPTMGTLTRICEWDDLFSATADVILILDCHIILHKDKINLYNHTIGKKLRFFTFLDTDFILQSEKKCGTMATPYDKVPYSVLLSSRRTPSCRSVSFSFLMCCFQRTNLDCNQKRLPVFGLPD